MYEHVFAAVFRSNETESFGLIKPLNVTFNLRHQNYLYMKIDTNVVSVTSTPIVVRFVQRNFTKSDKSRVILMLIILVVDFKEFTKTSFVSKLKAHPGKVHIAIVVGTGM